MSYLPVIPSNATYVSKYLTRLSLLTPAMRKLVSALQPSCQQPRRQRSMLFGWLTRRPR